MSAALVRRFTVARPLGLHARPAAEFARIANGHSACEISVAREGGGGEWVSGGSVLDLLSLGALQGVVLKVRARGEVAAAQRALTELGALIENPAEA